MDLAVDWAQKLHPIGPKIYKRDDAIRWIGGCRVEKPTLSLQDRGRFVGATRSASVQKDQALAFGCLGNAATIARIASRPAARTTRPGGIWCMSD
jgi:hypothetical protein